MEFLISKYFLLMQLIFFAVIALFFLNLKGIRSLHKGIFKENKIIFLILFFGLSLRIWFVPHIHHVYFDEFEDIDIGQNLSRGDGFQVTLKGSPENCEAGSLPARPPGYNAILAMAFFLLGASEQVAYGVNIFLGTISILLVFLIAALLFADKKIASWSAFLFSVLPVHLKYSGSAATEITSSFFVLLLLWAGLLYLKKQEFSILLLFIFTSIATLYMRPENLIFYIGAIIFILIMNFH